MRQRWAVLVFVAFAAVDARPCTTFCMNVDGQIVFGANYDWDVRNGLVMINKRSVAKESLTQRPANWLSQYASVTFNQYGRDFPTGGMNEAGLVVALMDLDVTEYPAVDSRPSAGVLDWIQYQLDVSADVDQVVVNAAAIRIATGSRGIHYLVADRTGRAVTIEHLGGALVTHRGATLPVSVLANSSYDQSLAYLNTMAGFGGTKPIPSGGDSLQRFARAASMVRATGSGMDPVARAFTILDSVHQPNTRWSIVYDPTAATVYFRTDQNPAVRWVALSSFDPSCASPMKIFDMNAPLSGDLTPLFTDYTSAANVNLVNTSYELTPTLQGASEESRRRTAMHPEKDVCVAQKRVRASRP